MLDRPDAEIVYDEQGAVTGVKANGEIAKCKAVVCDPSYAQEKCRVVGKVRLPVFSAISQPVMQYENMAVN